MALAIRPAQSADLAAIEQIRTAAFGSYVAVVGRAPAPMFADLAAQVAGGEVSVAVDAVDGVLGYIVERADGADWHVEALAVSPHRRRRGIAAALLDRAEARGRAAGCARVGLYTNVAMEAAQAFYRRRGYGEAPPVTEAGFRRIHFALPLGNAPRRPGDPP